MKKMFWPDGSKFPIGVKFDGKDYVPDRFCKMSNRIYYDIEGSDIEVNLYYDLKTKSVSVSRDDQRLSDGEYELIYH